MPFPALFRPRHKARKRWACQSSIARVCLVKRKIRGGRFWSVHCVTQARQWAEIRSRVFVELNVACWKWSQRSSAVSPSMLKMTDERRGLPGINILCTVYSEPTTFWNRTAILPASQVYIVNIVDHILDNTRDGTTESLLRTHFTLKSEFSVTGPVSGEGKALLMVIHYHLLIKGCTKQIHPSPPHLLGHDLRGKSSHSTLYLPLLLSLCFRPSLNLSLPTRSHWLTRDFLGSVCLPSTGITSSNEGKY